MYNKALNYMFNFFACLEKYYPFIILCFIRSKAIGLANKYVSNSGVQRNLQQRLRHNENFRYQISRGKIREEYATDKLDAARERIRGNYAAGLM